MSTVSVAVNLVTDFIVLLGTIINIVKKKRNKKEPPNNTKRKSTKKKKKRLSTKQKRAGFDGRKKNPQGRRF